MASIEDLEEIVAKEEERLAAFQHRILVCTASGCPTGQLVRQALADAVEEAGKADSVEVAGVGCMGLCAKGTLVAVLPDEVLYGEVTPGDAAQIVASIGAGPVERLVVDTDVPFFTRQQKIVLENSGRVDPDRIESYLAAGGYETYIRALTEMTPFAVLDEITRSGLRGRGGGGYPTGLKWATVAKAEGDQKYVICNADEGDPGAFMDRSRPGERPPPGARGHGAGGLRGRARARAIIYVRAEYPLAIERLQTAIKGAPSRASGPAGLRHHLQPHIEVRLGAGAFVCGEETALIASIEGRQGNPRPRPPYPAESGLWGLPTLINNVETYANVPAILRDGRRSLRRHRHRGSKGTKVFALAGKIQNTGLVEVPMGMTLQEIVTRSAAASPASTPARRSRPEGPSGGCIPADLFDTPVDYESLKELGSMMGSGGSSSWTRPPTWSTWRASSWSSA
jgi:bidirectional [NiFe] hydrogenase diaphorase subunit